MRHALIRVVVFAGRMEILLEGFVLLLVVGTAQARIQQNPKFSLVFSKPREISAEYQPTELLVKFKSDARPRLKSGNAADTGIASVNSTLAKNRVKKFERLAKSSPKARTNTELFGWYTIATDPSLPIVAKEVDGKTVYPDLEELQKELLKDSSVEAVVKNYTVSAQVVPNDPYYSSSNSWSQGYADLWGLQSINAATAWDTTTGSGSPTVAVIDTGIDRNHADISANIWTNSGETPSNGIDDDHNGYVDDVYGWNWCNGNNNTIDDNGHGTHVSGTIAGTGNNGSGVVGVSWSTKLMPLKFLCASGTGSSANGALALQYAADNGAKISSNSWGGSPANDQLVIDAINYEYSLGVVPIVAAGNNTSNALDYAPSGDDRAITVAATDHNNAIASFSNTGIRIDVSAPGVEILSLKSSSASVTCTGAAIVNTNYCHISGTSMATPHVSGLAALMLAVNPSLSIEQVRQILRTTATDLGTAGRDNTFGSGLINAASAVAASASPTVLSPYISNLKSRSTITGNTSITGSANGASFKNYKVEAGQGRTPSSWTTLTTSTSPVTSGTLVSFDTSTLPDGTYTFRLTSTDTSDRPYEYAVFDVAVDNFTMSFTSPFNLVALTSSVSIDGTVLTGNGLTLDHYVIDYGLGSTPSSYSTSGITLTGGGNSPVTDANLGTWNTSGLVDGQIYTLRLTAYATNGSTSAITTLIAPDSKLVTGWPKRLQGANCTTFCMGSATVMADLNADGIKELVTAGASNTLYAYNKDGTNVSGFPVTIPSTEVFYNMPVIADINGDLKPEIIINSTVAATNVKKMYVFKGDGTQYPGWTVKSMNGTSIFDDPTPSVADIDGDGVNEIVWYVYESGLNWLHVYKANNTEVSGFPKSVTYAPWINMPPTVADIDNDGHPEIILPSYNRLMVYTYQGNVKAGWPIALADVGGNVMTIQGPPAVGDVNGDGNPDIVFNGLVNGCIGCSIQTYAYSNSGSLMSGWPYSAVTALSVGFDIQTTALADIDNDGKDEVILGDGFSGVIDDGTGKRTYALTKNSQTAVSIADFAGNLSYKIAAAYNHGIGWNNLIDMSAYYQNNNLNSLSTNGLSEETVPVADMDKNGSLEYSIQLKNGNELYAYLWEMTGTTTNPKDSWTMFGHDPARTNHFTVGQKSTDTTAPQAALTSPAAGTSLSGIVTVSANATDDTAINKVEFYDGAGLIGTDTTFPYSISWDTSALSAGTHNLTAKAYDTASNTATSAAVATTKPDTTAPSTPANIHASAATSTTITVAWNASTDNVSVTGYNIYRNGTFITTSASLSYLDTGRSVSTSYTYAVSAYDAAANTSGQGSASLSTTADTTAPSVPGGLSASNKTATAQRINWSASSDDVGTTGYEVYRAGILIGTSAGIFYDDSGLSPLTSYSYTLKSFDAAGNHSAFSSALVSSTVADTTAPVVPGGLQITAATMTTQHLTWSVTTDNVGVAGYQVYRNNVLVGSTTTQTFYDNTGLTPGTQYSYEVTASDAANNTSVKSATLTASTSPDTIVPTAAFTAPVSDGSVFTGTAQIDGTAGDNYQVASLKLYIDSVLVASGGAAVSYAWDTTQTTNGSHALKLTASDTSNNQIDVDISISVNNPVVKVGDVNNDGSVNIFDLSILLAHWNTAYSPADFDHNNVVNIFDLSTLLGQYGK